MHWNPWVLLCLPLAAAETWTVRVEEPTGLYRRKDEVIAVPLSRLGGAAPWFQVVDADGRELPSQLAAGELLFPASAMPGETPEYRVSPRRATPPRFENQILLRKIGMGRVELGNSRFRLMIDTQVPAIVEAYSLTAGPQRVLNLVETTPEDPQALKDDIHGKMPPMPATGVEGENTGWTSLGGQGPMTAVELVETGPLRGRLRLSRENETWELLWTAGSGALRWKARRGFRFAAVSALPFLPFDRFAGGSEYEWPSGPEAGEPPDVEIGPRKWTHPPGGHCVYYARAENYGALGLVALDGSLSWRGAGSRRFEAVKAQGETEIALTFPEWKGDGTVLEARKENRLLREPLLVRVTGPSKAAAQVRVPARREPAQRPASGAPPPFAADAVSLDGDWELAWGEKGRGPGSEWRKVRVPGSAHTQWLDESKWYTREANWVSGKEWWYRKRFAVPERFRGRRLRLQFDATDYYAEAWLNGAPAGRHEGYIDPYECDVSRIARPGAENELLVRVWTPVTYYWRHRPYTIKGAYGAVDQKPDDITPVGITRSVRLVASTRPAIRDVAVDTRLVGGEAEVEVQVDADGTGSWDLSLKPRNFSSPESYRLRGSGSRFVFRLDRPRLWWTWDHGKPNLYTLDVRLLDRAGNTVDRRELAVGIREIEKTGWIFYLNRRRIFIRGTNYYFNLFLSEMNRAAYERDLKLMLGMNVNMIRLHCHFTNPEFYDLADERGVLIWQDYLEAWYPHDRAFSLRAAALYDNHIRYVRNHPSVALWATSDEEDLENYRDLTKHLAARPALLDPQRRPVVRSTGRYGDAHLYHGWYGGSIWDYAQMREAFVSELGATSLPNYDSLVKFLPNHWPIQDHREEWTFRKLQIPEAMRAWGEPGRLSLRDYIPRTQEYAARLFQLALERSRRLKYDPSGGILHFHAIDIWPSVTMAAVDFYRVPTRVYETVRRSFSPVLVSFEYRQAEFRPGDRISMNIWTINDLHREFAGVTLRWRLLDPNGAFAAVQERAVDIRPDLAQPAGTVEASLNRPGRWRLQGELSAQDGAILSANEVLLEVLPATETTNQESSAGNLSRRAGAAGWQRKVLALF